MAAFFSGTVPSASSIFSAYASLSAFIMLIQTLLNQVIPCQFQQSVINFLQSYFKQKPTKATVVIEEKDGKMFNNEVYNAAEIYLCTKTRPNIERLKICKRHKDPNLTIKFAQCEKITDFYQGIKFDWMYVFEESKKGSKGFDEDHGTVFCEAEKRSFELSFEKNYKDLVLDSYIPFVIEKAASIKAEKKIVKLHTLACGASYGAGIAWESINLEHPSTFGTLAMEPKQKKTITDDLDRFVRRKDFYRKVGRAWKRGYLLYGPPGTGKSSLIAAMANYLKFDIYDLELTNIRRDSDLRKLLLRTANRSILVIEDIDCGVELPDRQRAKSPGMPNLDGHYPQMREHFTLSGLLNFIDGLWSSCGDERIIIFTTNHKEKLDPALLRPGRMDMHIHMSYLTFDGFKLLASTYLNVHGPHPRYQEIEEMMEGMRVTPAEVAEEFMQSDDADTCLDGLVNFLQCKKDSASDNLKEEEVIDDEDEESDEVGQVSGNSSDDSEIAIVI